MSSVAVAAGREPQQREIVRLNEGAGVSADLAIPMTPADMIKRMDFVREVISKCMKKDVHFGIIQGTKDQTLFKPGIELLTQTFMLTPDYDVRRTDLPNGHREYEITCTLMHRATGAFVAKGMGSCSTMEKKYRWRNGGGRVCPDCGKATIKRSKFPPRDNPNAEPGWYCHEAIGGCGSQFDHDDEQIKSMRDQGQLENPDLADCYHTVLAMAQKRAHARAIFQAIPIGELFKAGDDGAEERRGTTAVPSGLFPNVDPALLAEYFEGLRQSGIDGNDAQLAAKLKRRAAKENWSITNEWIAERLAEMVDDGDGQTGAQPRNAANTPAAAPQQDFGIASLSQHVKVVGGFADDDAALAGLEKWYRATQQSQEGAEPWDVFKGATFNEAAVLKLKGLLTETNWAPYGGKPKGRK